jgi:hypothetical protein
VQPELDGASGCPPPLPAAGPAAPPLPPPPLLLQNARGEYLQTGAPAPGGLCAVAEAGGSSGSAGGNSTGGPALSGAPAAAARLWIGGARVTWGPEVTPQGLVLVGVESVLQVGRRGAGLGRLQTGNPVLGPLTCLLLALPLIGCPASF